MPLLINAIGVFQETTRLFDMTQDRQRMYNLILRRVRVTTVAVEKWQILHITSMCL